MWYGIEPITDIEAVAIDGRAWRADDPPYLRLPCFARVGPYQRLVVWGERSHNALFPCGPCLDGDAIRALPYRIGIRGVHVPARSIEIQSGGRVQSVRTETGFVLGALFTEAGLYCAYLTLYRCDGKWLPKELPPREHRALLTSIKRRS